LWTRPRSHRSAGQARSSVEVAAFLSWRCWANSFPMPSSLSRASWDRSPMPTARTSSCTSRRRNVSRRPWRACCTAPANARQSRMHRCDLSRRRPRIPQAPYLEDQPLLKPETTMKLLYQTHSPYARKALVFAHEAGLADRIEVVHNETSPTQRNEQVFAQNPLGKVPVLIRP